MKGFHNLKIIDLSQQKPPSPEWMKTRTRRIAWWNVDISFEGDSVFCLRSSAERNLVCLSPGNMAYTNDLVRSQVIYFVVLGKTELDLLRSESDFSCGVFSWHVMSLFRSLLICSWQIWELRLLQGSHMSCFFSFWGKCQRGWEIPLILWRDLAGDCTRKIKFNLYKEKSYSPSLGFPYSGQKKRVLVSNPAPKMTLATVLLLQAQIKPNQTQISHSSGPTPENYESCRITRCLIPFPEKYNGYRLSLSLSLHFPYPFPLVNHQKLPHSRPGSSEQGAPLHRRNMI